MFNGDSGYGGYDGGGASQFAGGGFMTSPGGGPPGANGGSGYGASRRGGGVPNAGVVPLTVRQIGTAETGDDSLIIDGQPLQNVTIVGRVLSRTIQAVMAEFTIDDGTGSIVVNQWLDDEGDQREQLQSIQINAYARIYGHFRHFNGKNQIQVFSIRPIADFNEITYHFLECIFVHLCNVKAQGGSIPAPTFGTSNAAPSYAAPQQVPAPSAAPAASSNDFGNQYVAPQSTVSSGSLRDLNSMVQAIFDDPAIITREEGLSWREVAQRVPGYSKEQVKEAIEFLAQEGHLYSTIDDDHFKSTGMSG